MSSLSQMSVISYFLAPKFTFFCQYKELLSRVRPLSMKLPTPVNATPTPAATKRKGKWIPHPTCPNNNPTMATARIYVLLFVLSATLAEDLKLKYKPSNIPVRLFTEEELKRYDGSEVNFYIVYTTTRSVSVQFLLCMCLGSLDPCNMR